MKYWNPRRIKRVRERKKKREEKERQRAREDAERARTYTAGDYRKNTELMLEALGSKLRRRMIGRLARGGAMSLSKLSDPLGLTLPAAVVQLRILERAGIVKTHKQGRIRFCVYNPPALKELGDHLSTKGLDLH